MHHRILLKVHGNTEEEAKSQAQSILEGTIRCGTCEKSVNGVNWDYIGYIKPINKATLEESRRKEKAEVKSPFQMKRPEPLFWVWKTPEEMADYFIKERGAGLTYLQERLKREIAKHVEDIAMTLEEAPLLIGNKTRGARATEILKEKNPRTEKPVLDTNEKITDFFTEVISHSVAHFDMIGYYMKEIEKMQACIKFGDADSGLYTLHCTDNHFSDMTGETAGEKVFYFWCDRHN